MEAILIGSIGALTETSEIQRQCFNQALAEYETGLYWNVANYCDLIQKPGGLERLKEVGIDEPQARAIHKRKQQLFSQAVKGAITPREGIVDLIAQCHSQGIKLGFITTTTPDTLQAVQSALSDVIDFSRFALITDATAVINAKPHPDIYHHALVKLGLRSKDVLVIEDSTANAKAAQAAGLACLLTPGEYALTSDLSDKTISVSYQNCANLLKSAA